MTRNTRVTSGRYKEARCFGSRTQTTRRAASCGRPRCRRL
ncbi:ORFS336C [Human betaherpesvirus 5]|nr:ORFS336C [Human betaherpesvirus 5]QHX40695.1 ORFS336C [Human betaherpesvirus 5]